MLGYSGIVAFAPKGQLGSVFGISFALGCFFASVLAALVGALLDRFGSDYAMLIGLFMMMYLSIVGLAVVSYKPTVAAYSE
jgi:MFS family permease